MHDHRPLPSIASQFALACNLTTAYYLITLDEGLSGPFFPLSMLAYAPLIYLINRVFLRRERTMLALTILNGFCGTLMLVGYLLLDQWRGFSYLACTTIFLTWLTVRGCQFVLNGPPLRGTLLTLDCSFLLLIAFIGYSSIMGWAAHWSIPALCGLSASMIAASASRSPHTLGMKGWLAVGGAFGLLVLLMWLFVEVMAAPAGSGLVAIWALLASGVNTLKQLLFRFLAFLLSLLPDADPGEMEWYEIPEFAIPEETPVAEASPVVGMIVLILAAACGAALLIWLVRYLGKLRLGRSHPKTTVSQPDRERTSILRGLLQMLSAWVEGVRLRFRLWKNRNTAVGLYFLLVHRCRRTPWHKRSGETPREFLLRMADAARSDAKLTDALEQLVVKTDAAFYSGRSDTSRLEYAPLIRHRIGIAVRKQFLSELLSRLRPRKTDLT